MTIKLCSSNKLLSKCHLWFRYTVSKVCIRHQKVSGLLQQKENYSTYHIRDLISFKEVLFLIHTLYPASFIMMETFLERLFGKSGKCCKRLDIGNLLAAGLLKAASEAMVTDRNSVVLWDEHILHTFLPSCKKREVSENVETPRACATAF